MAVETKGELTKDKVLARVPAFSPGVLRVIDLLSKEDQSATELAQAIASDPALAGQILRLANSALFGAQSRIDTVQKAVVAVGYSWIQHLTLALGAHNYKNAAPQTPELTRCWQHMLATAVLSRELARASGLVADRAYALGLLHDIGRLGLLAAFPAEYAAAVSEAEKNCRPIRDLERETFGVDHCEIGRSLVTNWNLPSEFAEVVERHHELSGGGPMDSVRVAQLACRLADTLGFFFTPPAMALTLVEVRAMLPDFAQQRFPAEKDALRALLDQAMQEGELALGEPVPLPVAAPEAAAAAEAEALPKWLWMVAAAFAILAAAAVALHWIR